jgi:Phage capsid scaffolding protein (GPO) serine peptidase
MAKKSKWFRVAIEGATTDGREINRADIVDMAATYNRDTYGARVNQEHFRGLIAGGPFDSLGDVLALRAQEDELTIGGKAEKRMSLYAEIQPLDNLVKMNGAGQKIFTSVEIQPDFAKTGKAGLVGLAVTDSPTSLGTEVLTFAAKNPSVFAARKQAEGNLFTEALETKMEFVDVDDENATEASAFASIANFFNTLTGKAKVEQVETQNIAPVKTGPSGEGDPALAALGAEMAKFTSLVGTSLKALTDGQKAQAAELAALKTKLETEPDPKHLSRRQKATGGAGYAQADY